MSEMINRVAMAIEETYEKYADPTPAQRARAAILAMRDCTEEMDVAGTQVNFDLGSRSAWQAMIDEALKDHSLAE